MNWRATTKIINELNTWIGKSVSWLIAGMVFVTFLIVVLRYGFGIGWVWMQESVLYMHATVFLMAASFSFLNNEHVRIDIFYQKMSERKKAWVEIFGILFFLFPFCGLIFFQSYSYVENSWTVKESSQESGGLPVVYLLKTLLLLFPILFSLQGVSHLIHSLLIIKKIKTSHGNQK